MKAFVGRFYLFNKNVVFQYKITLGKFYIKILFHTFRTRTSVNIMTGGDKYFFKDFFQYRIILHLIKTLCIKKSSCTSFIERFFFVKIRWIMNRKKNYCRINSLGLTPVLMMFYWTTFTSKIFLTFILMPRIYSHLRQR